MKIDSSTLVKADSRSYSTGPLPCIGSEICEMRGLDRNGPKLSRICDAEGICASWGHAFKK